MKTPATRRAIGGPALLIWAMFCCLTGMQNARADGLALAGADVSNHGRYFYAGALVPLGGSLGASGAMAKLWAFDMRYDYQASGSKVKANAHGFQLAAGYQWLREAGYTSVYLGVDRRDTDLPNGVNSGQRGRRTGAAAEFDLTQELSRDIRFDGIVTYSGKNDEYWGRARLMNRTAGSWRWGPQLILQGNSDYSAYRAGIALSEIPLSPAVRIEGSAGYAKTKNLSGGAYAGTSLVISF